MRRGEHVFTVSRRLGGAGPKSRGSRGASVDIRRGEVEQGLIAAVEELAPGGWPPKTPPIAAEQVTGKHAAMSGTEIGDTVWHRQQTNPPP